MFVLMIVAENVFIVVKLQVCRSDTRGIGSNQRIGSGGKVSEKMIHRF